LFKVLSKITSGEKQQLGNKLYGGAFFLDPDFWKKSGRTEEDLKKVIEATSRTLRTAPPEVPKVVQRMIPKADLQKRLLENPKAQVWDRKRTVVARPGKSLSFQEQLQNKLAKTQLAQKIDAAITPADVMLDMIGANDGKFKNPVIDLKYNVDNAKNGALQQQWAWKAPLIRVKRQFKL